MRTGIEAVVQCEETLKEGDRFTGEETQVEIMVIINVIIMSRELRLVMLLKFGMMNV